MARSLDSTSFNFLEVSQKMDKIFEGKSRFMVNKHQILRSKFLLTKDGKLERLGKDGF